MKQCSCTDRSWKGGGGKPKRLPHRHMAQERAPKRSRNRPPQPPARDALPLIKGSDEIGRWLDHYWLKLRLPTEQAQYLAVTNDRNEFSRWTGRRLNPLALGCYCYLPLPDNGNGEVAAGELDYSDTPRATRIAPAIGTDRRQLRLPGFNVLEDDEMLPSLDDPVEAHDLADDYRHLIFIEPGMTDVGIEVTVAHELIHLSDRVQGRPRRHHCHGHDAISVDEAVITGRDPEYLRVQLRDETERREAVLRERRPYRYVYSCPNCKSEYPRVQRYSRTISCGHCDDHFNPAFELSMRELSKGERYEPPAAAGSPAQE
jgi:ribosomal protein L37AE/L43A